jgi:hypothetical protein
VKPLDRQASDKGSPLARPDHTQAIGLVFITGQFGEELVVGNPGAGGQRGHGMDALPNELSNPRRRTDAADIGSHIKIGLIEGKRLDMRGIIQKNRADLLRYALVDVEPGPAKHQFGAEARRPYRRHRRTHPECARLIAGSRHHPASG